MHGIADPLTKLSLTITAGGVNTEASVRAGKRREAGGGPGYLTRRTRLCEGSHVRRLSTELSLGRREAALQLGARASTVRQGLIIKEPN